MTLPPPFARLLWISQVSPLLALLRVGDEMQRHDCCRYPFVIVVVRGRRVDKLGFIQKSGLHCSKDLRVSRCLLQQQQQRLLLKSEKEKWRACYCCCCCCCCCCCFVLFSIDIDKSWEGSKSF